MDNPLRYQQARKVTIIGAIVNLCLGIIKILFGIIGHSQALFADGIHSLSDLITDALVLIAAKMGAQKADNDHPYGHGRIETAAAVALALLLILVGIGIFIDAAAHLFGMLPLQHPTWPVLVVAFISIVANEFIYQYTMHVANKINSNLLRGNAWHSRTDALSSLIVFVGVLGAILGFHHADAIAAMVVSIFIMKMGASIGWSSMRELIDTGVDEQELEKIKQQIRNVTGVRSLHQLRTRSMAGDIFVDVHIQVDSKLSVSEGHYIGDHVRQVLLDNPLSIADVTVHVDPEDDEVNHTSSTLPQREEINALLQQRWQALTEYNYIQRITLHYLSGKIAVEIEYPLEKLNDIAEAETLQAMFASKVEQDLIFSEVKLFFS